MSSEVPSGLEIFTPEFVQTRMAVQMAKGLRITPFLNRDTVPSRSVYTFFSEDATPEEDIADGTMAKPYRVAPGADLTPIRMSDLNADSQPVEVRGFKLEVDNQKLEEQGQSVIRFMDRMSYRIGREVESDSYTRLAADAAASAATLTDGNWDDSTGINKDIIRMQEAFQDDSLPDELTGLFYEGVNHRELKEYLDDTGSSNEVIYNNQNDLEYKGTRHIYGGRNMVHGTALGFDLTNPPSTVVYGTVKGASSPSTLPGMEGFAPLLNVKITPKDEGLYPKTVIEMAAETTVVTELPAALLKQTGL